MSVLPEGSDLGLLLGSVSILFSLGGAFDDISPISPRLLGPYDENNPDTWIDVPVSFTPTHNADQETTLVVQARGVGDAAEDVVVSTRLAASSLGPPRIIVHPTEWEFRDPRGAPTSLPLCPPLGYATASASPSGLSASLSG